MSDFSKAKVGFALALAGVLFAIHPIITEHRGAGFSFPWFVLEFRIIYYLLFALLGTSVYFFALEFLTLRPQGAAHRIGNLLYAAALLIPPAFVMIWLAVQVGEGVVWISDSDAAGEISMVAICIVSGAAGLLVIHLVSRVMNLRDREASIDQLSIRESRHLHRAEEMHGARHYDLAAIEAFRAIETALHRALIDRDVRVGAPRARELIPAAARAGIIPEECVGLLHEVRVARNRAVHATDPIALHDAEWLLDTTRKIIASIRAGQDADSLEDDVVAG